MPAGRWIVLASLLACAAAGPAGAANGRAMEFRVPSLTGGTISNEDFKGKIVIVDVWATWCGPCRMIIPRLVDLQEKFSGRGVSVLGLNADSEPGGAVNQAAIRSFAREFGVNYPIGLMNTQAYIEVARIMGTNPADGMSIPTTILLARNGKVIKRYPGYFQGQEQEIEAIISKIIDSEQASRTKP